MNYGTPKSSRGRVAEFARAAVGKPFDDVHIASRIDGQGVRLEEFVGMLRRLVRFNAGTIAQARHRFVVGVVDADASAKFRNVEMAVVLIEAAGHAAVG